MSFSGMGQRLVRRFGRAQNYPRIRRGPGTYSTGGIYQPAATETANISAFIWPAKGEELQRLPEGSQSLEAIQVATPDDLRAGNQNGPPADLVVYRGEQWEVQLVNRWDEAGLNVATAVRVRT